jgi:hypothetical protein
MIPAIAVMIAAYAIPRLFIDALRFTWESSEFQRMPHRLARVFVWVLALGGIGMVVVSLIGVMAAGVNMSDLPSVR